jgi:D-glycero-D-manno-heptose 1,7-bisphosphate phosphatase
MPGRIIILDRDGVINEDSPAFIKTPDEWRPIVGSLEAIARLNHKGYRPIVITNQSALARGLCTLDDLNAIHRRMREELTRVGGHLEAILFCPHGPEDRCECRKPRPGLFLQAAERFCQPLSGVIAIGDSLRDIQAARAVGCQPLLVESGKGVETLRDHPHISDDTLVCVDLAQAVDELLKEM